MKIRSCQTILIGLSFGNAIIGIISRSEVATIVACAFALLAIALGVLRQ